MTIASLDGVANIPATATIFVCRTRARILCSRRVCSRVRLRLFRNFTATSRPVKISWQRRTTENRPRPTFKNNLLIYIFPLWARAFFSSELAEILHIIYKGHLIVFKFFNYIQSYGLMHNLIIPVNIVFFKTINCNFEQN